MPRINSADGMSSIFSICVLRKVHVSANTRHFVRLAIILNWVMGVFLPFASTAGAIVDLFPSLLVAPNADGEYPIPFDPLILAILFIFGIVFIMTARSLQDLPLTPVFRLRDFLSKRKRIKDDKPYFASKMDSKNDRD